MLSVICLLYIQVTKSNEISENYEEALNLNSTLESCEEEESTLCESLYLCTAWRDATCRDPFGGNFGNRNIGWRMPGGRQYPNYLYQFEPGAASTVSKYRLGGQSCGYGTPTYHENQNCEMNPTSYNPLDTAFLMHSPILEYCGGATPFQQRYSNC